MAEREAPRPGGPDVVIAMAEEFARRRGEPLRLPTTEDFTWFRDDPEMQEKFRAGLAALGAGRRIRSLTQAASRSD